MARSLFTMCTRVLLVLVLVLCGGRAEAQRIGSTLPDFELANLTGTAAKSLADFEGRALLLEFFSDT